MYGVRMRMSTLAAPTQDQVASFVEGRSHPSMVNGSRLHGAVSDIGFIYEYALRVTNLLYCATRINDLIAL